MSIEMKIHPCFHPEARGKYARVHLPVAPKCNIQCGYCNRKYDCVNESRPGVTSNILSPGQAIQYLKGLKDDGMPVSVAGIAGPGDPFANPDETMDTLRLIRAAFPEILLCVSSNGLNIAPFIDELKNLEVSHITITINAIDPEIGAKIYQWIRYDKKVFRGIEAANLILAKQLEAVALITDAGIKCKVNTILIPGINEHHVEDVAEHVASLGATYYNCIPLVPVADTLFGDLKEPSKEMLHGVRAKAGKHIPQMLHCARCRADAAGFLGQNNEVAIAEKLQKAAAAPLIPNQKRPYIAAATMEGVLVNQHLGEAEEFHIFEKLDGQVKLKGIRPAPTPGCGDSRWKRLGEVLSDCSAVLVGGIGQNPQAILNDSGLKTFLVEGIIEEAAGRLFDGESIQHMQKRAAPCGVGCNGSAQGCA